MTGVLPPARCSRRWPRPAFPRWPTLAPSAPTELPGFGRVVTSQRQPTGGSAVVLDPAAMPKGSELHLWYQNDGHSIGYGFRLVSADTEPTCNTPGPADRPVRTVHRYDLAPGDPPRANPLAPGSTSTATPLNPQLRPQTFPQETRAGAQVEEDRPRAGASVVQSVRFSAEPTERLMAEAARRGVTPSEVIRDLVEAGLRSVDESATVRLADVRRALDDLAQRAARW
jgi:predicted DNA-binding protein